MKKFGFTLTELLITIGIIGIAAALVAPTVTNITPNKNKMMFIKNYKELATITEKILNDPELYQTVYELAPVDGEDLDNDGTVDFLEGCKYPTCIGLRCQQQPTKAPYNTDDFKDEKKFPYLLASFLGSEIDKTKQNYCFRTNDNTYWDIVGVSSDGKLSYYQVKYSVNQNTDSIGTIYDGTSTKTNTFEFKVDYRGNITPEDSLSKAYLINPINMNEKKKDFACAAAIENNSTSEPSEICANLED